MNNQVLAFLIFLILYFVLDFVYVPASKIRNRVKLHVTCVNMLGSLSILLIPFLGLVSVFMIFMYAAKLWYTGKPEYMFWDQREIEVMESQIMEGQKRPVAYINAVSSMIRG